MPVGRMHSLSLPLPKPSAGENERCAVEMLKDTSLLMVDIFKEYILKHSLDLRMKELTKAQSSMRQSTRQRDEVQETIKSLAEKIQDIEHAQMSMLSNIRDAIQKEQMYILERAQTVTVLAQATKV